MMLPDWVAEFLYEIYGTTDNETGDGRRYYRRSYQTCGKKNGKSTALAIPAIYHLLYETGLEPSPLEAYGAAASKEQAGIVFRAAARIVNEATNSRGERWIQNHLKVIDSVKRIVRRDGRGFYHVISADGDLQDGIHPSLAIVDELHRWKTKKHSVNWDVITKGVISRREPLVAVITTRAGEFECPLWEKEDEIAQRVQNGTSARRGMFVQIYSADEQRMRMDPDYWKSREARVAANPSHEDRGGFLEDRALVAELQEAIEDPSKKPSWLRYNLNVKVAEAEYQAIDMTVWRDYQPTDLRTWETYDVDKLVRDWGLAGRTCYSGVDLSATTDLTALELLFPPEDDGSDIWKLLSFAWLPESQVAALASRDKVDYPDWVRRGFIEVVPKPYIDPECVVRRVDWARKNFQLAEVCWDPWNAATTISKLEEEGVICPQIKQSYGELGPSWKSLKEIYLDGRLVHGNHPVLDFCAASLALKHDGQGNYRPIKPEREKTGKRIDCMVALLTAGARAFVVAGRSQYTGRILVLEP